VRVRQNGYEFTSTSNVTGPAPLELFDITAGAVSFHGTVSGLGALYFRGATTVVTFANPVTMMASATIVAQNAATAIFNGAVSGSAFVYSYTGGRLRFNGGLNAGNIVQSVDPGGELEFNGPGSLIPRLILSAGTVLGAADVTITGTSSEWNGGTMIGTGKTIIASTGELNVGGAGTKQSARPLENNGALIVANGSALELSGDFDGDGATMVAAGSSLTANRVRQASLTIAGLVTTPANGGADSMSIFSELSIAAGGKLNLNDNDLIVNYAVGDPSPEFSLRDLVLRARDVGDYGIFFTGSDDDFSDKVLAFGEAAELGFAEFNGVTVDGTTVLGKYTYYGDANFDGQVTTDDYVSVDLGLGTGDSWVQGDFDLNGVVTTDDYVVVDLNLGKGSTSPLAIEDQSPETNVGVIETTPTKKPKQAKPLSVRRR
jgi:hypothetical protein